MTHTLPLEKQMKTFENLQTSNSYTITGLRGRLQVHLYFSRDTSFPSISKAENAYIELALCQSIA